MITTPSMRRAGVPVRIAGSLMRVWLETRERDETGRVCYYVRRLGSEDGRTTSRVRISASAAAFLWVPEERVAE